MYCRRGEKVNGTVPMNGDNQWNSLYRWESKNRRSSMHRKNVPTLDESFKATEHKMWNTRTDTQKTTIETNK